MPYNIWVVRGQLWESGISPSPSLKAPGLISVIRLSSPFPAKSSPQTLIFSYCLPTYVVTIAGFFGLFFFLIELGFHFFLRPVSKFWGSEDLLPQHPMIPINIPCFLLIFLSQNTEHFVFCLILLLFI